MSNPFDTSKAARGSTLLAIKTAQKAREEEEKVKARRRRGVVVMMMQFLQESGYKRTLDALEQESQTSLSKVAPADNMDLAGIFSQYEEYHEIKFGRRPRFFRNVDGGGEGTEAHTDANTGEGMLQRKRQSPPPRPGHSAPTRVAPPSSGAPTSTPPDGQGRGGVNPRAKRLDDSQPLPPIPGKGGAGAAASGLDNMAAAGVGIKKLQAAKDEDEELVAFQGRTKALPDFGTKELNEIAQTVYRDILDEDPSVTFDTIAELDAAKRLLKEAVVMPTKYPQLFQGLVRPWKGILLFGPPGTGKTMLAKAVATECHTTFFNMSASTLVSKWRGDSEKLVRMLFDLAVHFAPSTIFLDELDAMLSARGGGGQEHEATRRMKTEFLVQMDGLSKRRNGDIVFVLAASNLPWDLDSAVLRRLEKRIFVPLPSIRGREILLRQNLPHVAPGFDFEKIAGMLQGFSGADVDILCREGTMRTVRLLIDRLERDKDLDDGKEVPKPLVSMSDMVASIAVTRPSAQSVPLRQYVAWEKSFGSTMSLEDGSSAAVSATPRKDAADADDGDEGANT